MRQVKKSGEICLSFVTELASQPLPAAATPSWVVFFCVGFVENPTVWQGWVHFPDGCHQDVLPPRKLGNTFLAESSWRWLFYTLLKQCIYDSFTSFRALGSPVFVPHGIDGPPCIMYPRGISNPHGVGPGDDWTMDLQANPVAGWWVGDGPTGPTGQRNAELTGWPPFFLVPFASSRGCGWLCQ